MYRFGDLSGRLAKLGEQRLTRAVLLPYINLEDLSDPRHLLLLLKSRGRNSPDIFAYSDVTSMTLVWRFGSAPLKDVDDARADLIGGTPETYGRIIPAQELPGKDVASHLDLTIPASECLVMLAAQEDLLRFLEAISEQILADIPPENLLQSEVKPEPEITVGQVRLWTDSATWRLEAPYKLPGLFDVSRLSDLTQASLSDARDHVDLLREDPAYFYEEALDWSQYRSEMVRDATGQKDVCFRSTGGQLEFYKKVLAQLVSHALQTVFIWQSMSRLLEAFEKALLEFSTCLDPVKCAPDPIEQAYSELYCFITTQQARARELLCVCMCPAPAFRLNCIRFSDSEKSCVDMKAVMPQTKDDELWRLVEALSNSSMAPLFGVDNLVDRIQYIIDSDQKDRTRMTPFLSKLFGQFAFYTEMQQQLDLFQPWACRIRKDPTTDELRAHVRPMNALINSFRIKDFAATARDMMMKSNFHYPVERRRTKETVGQMRAAEEILDNLWIKVDGCVSDFWQQNPELAHFADVLQPSTIERTPPWVEPEQPAAFLQKASYHPNQLLETKLNLLELEFRTKLPVDTQTTSPKQAKLKTRGAPTVKPTTDAAPPPRKSEVDSAAKSDEPLPAQPRLHVSKRALKVFRTLFHDPLNASGTPGELHWNDYLAAMGSMGFRMEKLYGSVWQFTPTLFPEVQRSIQMHEPHPVAKWTYWQVHCRGRRLARVYGWTSETFVGPDAR